MTTRRSRLLWIACSWLGLACGGGVTGEPEATGTLQQQDKAPRVLLAVQRDRADTEQIFFDSDRRATRLRYKNLIVRNPSEFEVSKDRLEEVLVLVRGVVSAQRRPVPEEEETDPTGYVVFLPAADGQVARTERFHEDELPPSLKESLGHLFDAQNAAETSPVKTTAWARAVDYATAMGLDPEEARDPGAFLEARNLPYKTLSAEDRLIPACTLPGFAVPVSPPLDTPPGNPVVVAWNDRFFAVYGLHLQK